MNSRILKKHCKRADLLLQRFEKAGYKHDLERFVTGEVYGSGDCWQGFGFDLKSYERIRGRKFGNYLRVMDGTVGYGGMSGYYEPEWSDRHAYSLLFDIVSSELTDWDAVCLGDESPWNHYHGPRYRDHRGVFAAAEKLIKSKGGEA